MDGKTDGRTDGLTDGKPDAYIAGATKNESGYHINLKKKNNTLFISTMSVADRLHESF